MFRKFVTHLCDHPVFAGLIAAFFYLSGLFAIFAMPVFVTVTLQNGATQGVVALAVSVVVLILFGLTLPHNISLAVAPAFALGGLLFVGAAALLRRGRGLAFVVTLVSLLVLAVFAGYALAVPHPIGTFVAAVRTTVAHQQALLARHYPAEAKAWGKSFQALRPLYPYLLGLLGLYIVFAFAVDLFLGAGIHSAAYSPGSYGRHFRAFRVGVTPAVLALAFLAVTLIAHRPLVVDALLLLLPLFFLQGLARVHAWVHGHPSLKPLLILLYALIVASLLFGGFLVYVVYVLVLTGWFDNFLKRSPASAMPPSSPGPR